MESALAAVILIFVVLFGVLTLSNTLMSTQDTLHVSWEESDLRLQEQGRTGMELVRTLTHAGTQVELTLKNTGSVRLADFNEWDMIVEYEDANSLVGHHIEWLPYTKELTGAGAWTVQGIYADAEAATPEAFDPGIFDPGEEMILSLQVDPAIAAGSYVQVVVSPPNGVSTSTIFKRNVPPVLATNAPILVNNGESVTIAPDNLETTDVDDQPSDLVYSVASAPAEGALTPETAFTQADINNGLLSYSNSGTSATDSFDFTVTDGEDTIGTYTAQIQVNMIPSLDVNAGMSLQHGTAGLIGDLMLHVSDADNSASELVFTITKAPLQGNLSKASFTQDDINTAHLNYTNTGSSAGTDSFEFTVSDGHKVIGPFTFSITVS